MPAVGSSAAPRLTWSGVVPVLNEAAGLPALVARLHALQAQGAHIVLVDGGSSDGSMQAAMQAGLAVLQTGRGRARQMNAGAHASASQCLLFLHADTVLPAGALDAMSAALAHPDVVAWGRFDVRIDGQHPMLKVVAWFMNQRSRLTGIATGDQCLFMTRAAWEAVGGFPEQPLMEDIELSTRLKALARPVCLRLKVSTSGRRWEQRGVWSTIWLMWILRWRYWRGADPAHLAELYR